MGVWIEIISDVSSPLCGLVTPFMGVWIEIKSDLTPSCLALRHSLHGSVD